VALMIVHARAVVSAHQAVAGSQEHEKRAQGIHGYESAKLDHPLIAVFDRCR
jgi:hypothetical protein